MPEPTTFSAHEEVATGEARDISAGGMKLTTHDKLGAGIKGIRVGVISELNKGVGDEVSQSFKAAPRCTPTSAAWTR